ncbi:MAG TPA: hypothetical protein VFT22_05960, partial [Kofleriaceae bacterium]|nr:hypothetical protein [Kofleriaceae bacterium]
MAAPSSNHSPRLRPVLRPSRAGTARHLLWWADGKISPYLYIAPFFLLFIGFGLFPILYTGYV